MLASLRSLVKERASQRCEYCHLPERLIPIPAFHIEHIVAKQHGGTEQESNLALSCDRCNAYKGPNLTTLDDSGEPVRLFHPREDQWDEHFEIQDGIVVGKSVVGASTVRLLQMNRQRRVRLRRMGESSS